MKWMDAVRDYLMDDLHIEFVIVGRRVDGMALFRRIHPLRFLLWVMWRWTKIIGERIYMKSHGDMHPSNRCDWVVEVKHCNREKTGCTTQWAPSWSLEYTYIHTRVPDYIYTSAGRPWKGPCKKGSNNPSHALHMQKKRVDYLIILRFRKV